MSGKVNSAGSKSGVIGVTELDYEEGTHTVAEDAGSGAGFAFTAGHDVFNYTRIGRIVHIVGQLSIASVTNTPSRCGFSLPFVSGTGFPSVTSNCVLVEHVYDVSYGIGAYIGAAKSYMYMYVANDNSGLSEIGGRVGQYWYIGITYSI